ncbi:MAG TPA: RidA family protein [Blastocatellia bacterium]|nr:RidA family protein [Blastocatellia bacterium]
MKHFRSFATIAVVVVALALSTQSRQPNDSGQQKTDRAQSAGAVEYSSAASTVNRPFSDYVKVGNVLYLSGKLGTDSSGKLAAGGITAETKQTLENIRSVLEKNGSSLDQVVKCTVMLADMKEWADMNSVYTTFFKKERMPARSAFGTTGLALNARVEIECIAVMK